MKRLFKRAIMICIVLFLVLTAINLYVIKSVQPYIYKDMAKVPTRDVVIVLGAALREGKPSPVLEDRVKAGIYLYEKGQVKKILLSGDHGRVEHDEVNSMREYILEHEKTIEKADIFLDHAGFDTYNTMYRAKEIFQIKNAVIVTQDFHINRAVYTPECWESMPWAIP